MTSVLFHGVPGAPEPPTDPARWHSELPTLVAEGLAGMALSALPERPEAFGGVADVLTRAHRAEIAMSLLAEARAPDVIGRLERDGVPAVVIKGPGIAQRYPSPGLRPFEDVDLLVPAERFTAAIESLTKDGFRVPPSPRDSFLLWCREGVNLGRADGASIDLHHRVAPWVFTEGLTFPRIAGAAVRFGLGRGEVRGASAIHNLLISALQIIGFRPGLARKLKAWRDVQVLAADCDPTEAALEARGVELDWYVALVLRAMPTYARPAGLLRSLEDVQPSRRQLSRLRRLVPPGIGARNYSIGRLFRLPPVHGLAYVFAKTFPSGAFLEELFGSRWAYVRWWRAAQAHLLEAATVSGDPSHWDAERERLLERPDELSA